MSEVGYEMGEEGQKVKSFSYKNKSQGCNGQHGD